MYYGYILCILLMSNFYPRESDKQKIRDVLASHDKKEIITFASAPRDAEKNFDEAGKLKKASHKDENDVYIDFLELDNQSTLLGQKEFVRQILSSSDSDVVFDKEIKAAITPMIEFPFEKVIFSNAEFLQKKSAVEKVVASAVSILEKKSIIDSCAFFTQDKKWKYADTFIFLVNQNGICYVDNSNGNDSWRLLKDDEKEPLFHATETGSWVMHSFRGEGRFSYVKKIIKDGGVFYIGSGIYIEDLAIKLQELMNSCTFFSQTQTVQGLARMINEKKAYFFNGQSGVICTIFDEEGIIVADTRDKNFVGQFFSKTYVKGISVYNGLKDHVYTGMPLYFYLYMKDFKKICCAQQIEEVYEGKEKKYTVYMEYLYDVRTEDVTSFVVRASFHLQQESWEKVFLNFMDTQSDFCVGAIRVLLFDLSGRVLADAYNPDIIGKNVYTDPKVDELIPCAKYVIDAASRDPEDFVSFIGIGGYTQVFYRTVQTIQGNFILCTEYPLVFQKDIASSIMHTLNFTSHYSFIEDICAKLMHIPEYLIPGLFEVNLYSSSGMCVAGTHRKNLWVPENSSKQWKSFLDLARSGGGFVFHPESKKTLLVQQLNARLYQGNENKIVKKINKKKKIKWGREDVPVVKYDEPPAVDDYLLVVSFFS